MIEEGVPGADACKDVRHQVVLDPLLLVHQDQALVRDQVEEEFPSAEQERNVLCSLRPRDQMWVVRHLCNSSEYRVICQF